MRRRSVALTVVAGVAVAVVPAHSAWKATGQVTLAAQSSSLAAPGAITAGTATTTSIALSWVATASLPGGPISYVVERTPAGTASWVAACGTSAATTTTTPGCTDSGLTASTAYEYRVTSVYAKWRRQGSPSGVMTTAATPPPAAGTGTKLRLTACTDGVVTGYRGKDFVSTVQVLDARNAPVADNAASFSVAVSVTGTGATSGPAPSVLTVPRSSSLTSESTTVTMDNGSSNNGKNEFVVSVVASGLTSATCTVRK